MASAADKIRKKNKPGNRDWSDSGSFINKPAKGWLHPDEQLAVNAGICYGVRVWKESKILNMITDTCSFNC